jgi:hypothetical protein
MERQTRLQHSECHRRNWTCCQGHADKMRHHPVDIPPFLEPSCVLGIPIGAPARGRPTSPQRRMEGLTRIGMHRCLWGGKRRCGVGRLGRRGWGFWTWATALVPWRSCVLAPHCDPCAARLRGPPPLARPPGFTAQLQPATPRAPLPSGQQGQSARGLAALAQAP